jgi:hypothetical protein
MQLFNRAVSLLVENGTQDTSVMIEKLQVEFNITRTLEKENSTLVAEVYNLSETTRSFLEAPERLVITLSAGYGEDLHDLFVGDVRIVRHTRDGADIQTTIEADDGGLASKKWARKQFPAGTLLDTIFKYLLDYAGIGEGNVAEATAISETYGVGDKIVNGWHARGYAVDLIRSLANSRGIDFSIQSGEAQFLPLGDVKQGIPIVEVAPGSGLIGSPTIDNEGVMSCETLLLPNVFPGTRIDVKSEFVDGRFKVQRADYSGSVFGDDFSISIEGKELELS